jgi:hypothetical protein
MKVYSHDYFLMRDLPEVDLDGDKAAADDPLMDVALGPEEESSTIAVLMQTTGGKPSNTLSHVFPSSLEPNTFPLRVPK